MSSVNTTEIIHRAVSADGTELAGRVVGTGPALVLVHGAIGDGEFAWEAVLPHLTDHFTCYLPSTRGRGRSADNPDHSPPRFAEDVLAFVESIGEPVRLVGWSGSGGPVLGVAAQSPAVVGVAAFEPMVLLPDVAAVAGADVERLQTGIGRTGELAAAGNLTEAVSAFFAMICNGDEYAGTQADRRIAETWAQGIPAMMRFIGADQGYAGPRPIDPASLARIGVPTLLLQGQRTALTTLFGEGLRYLGEHIAHAETRVIPDVGHFAPVFAPEATATELTAFFERS